LKKLLLFALLAVAVALAFTSHAEALQGTLGTLQITVNIAVTPSPIAYAPGHQLSSSAIAYVPQQLGDMVAQAAPEGHVKVDFTQKQNPIYQYFHIIPQNSTYPGMMLNAGYGSNTYACVFQIYAKYAYAYTVVDYAYGSNTSGGTAGLNGFPLYNTPTTSDLAWLAETKTTSYAPFANAGPPGQTVFTGSANQAQTICIDLRLTVPSTIPAGNYSATISYRMTYV
jgi:hypothetical protein